MVKRKLTSDEQKMCQRAVDQLKKRNSLIGPKIRHLDYMMVDGLRIGFEEQYQEILTKKTTINQEVYLNDLKIIELQRQIYDGVEIKKDKIIMCPQCGQEIKGKPETK